MPSPPDHPKLRPVEAMPARQDGDQMFVVYDPSGLAPGSISLSRAALFILSLMDGQRSLADIQAEFARQAGQPLPGEHLAKMVGQLDAAHYLDSPALAAHVASLAQAYQAAPTRASGDAVSLGADEDGLATMLDRMLAGCQTAITGPPRSLAGLIAPHLDYARGAPGYADAYGLLAMTPPPRRVVVLDTNHFGQSIGPVATRKDFETPLGTTPTDRAFIETLADRLHMDLYEHEFDHAREHSVELQVVILQQLLGVDAFEMVPILCSDPGGPTGTASHERQGANLRAFGEALGELIRSDEVPTLVVAGADLSHVGMRFGDDRELDDDFLREVERKDRSVLEAIVSGGRDDFVETLRRHENSTRVCSVGCIYALLTALPETTADVLSYHQAVDRDSGTCVTCSSLAFWPDAKAS